MHFHNDRTHLNMKAWEISLTQQCRFIITLSCYYDYDIIIAAEQNNLHSVLLHPGHAFSQKLTDGTQRSVTVWFTFNNDSIQET
jgi:hypothetical protein